jgi:hypothetical protein
MLASSVSADMTRFDPPDPRLDKKVTLEVNYVKLQDVADSLCKQSGVVIKAGSGERDWKVREQLVSIHAKDIPLSKALGQIEKLLSYCVSREGKDKEWTYTIWQDKKGRDLEAEMLNAQREEAAQRIAKSRQGTIDMAKDALGMSPQDAMKQKDKNPMLALMGGTKSGRGFAAFLNYFQSSFPTEYDLMMRGKRVFVSLTGLPANMQQAVADMTTGGMAETLKKMLNQEMKPGEKMPDLTPYQMVFQPANEQAGADVESLGFGGLAFLTGIGPDGKPFNTDYGGGIPMSISALTDPGSAIGKLLGEMLLKVEDGMSLDEANKQLNERANNDPSFAAEALAQDSPTEKNPPADPELTREVEIKDVLTGANVEALTGPGADKYQGKMLAEISRAIGYPVFKESFGAEMTLPGLFIHPGKQPLYKVLIGLEKAGCAWAKDDGALRIRDKNWALLRSYAIPESFTAAYKDLLDKTGELTLEDIAGIASGLSDDQIRHTLVSTPGLSPAVDCVAVGASSTREILRLYASLSEKQKTDLNSDAGLPFSGLSDAQWDRMNAIICDRLGGVFIQDGSIRLAAQTGKEPPGRAAWRRFDMTAQVSGEKDPRSINEFIPLASKDQIKAAKDARKKAEEAAKAQQTKPAQAK